jgi:hypothetical protein
MISDALRVVIRRLDRNKIIILILEVLLLAVHYFILSYLLAIRLFAGIISYILIPGYLLVKVLNIHLRFEETLGLSLLFGLLIPTRAILILALAIISVFPMHSVYLTKFKEGYADVVDWYGARALRLDTQHSYYLDGWNKIIPVIYFIFA